MRCNYPDQRLITIIHNVDICYISIKIAGNSHKLNILAGNLIFTNKILKLLTCSGNIRSQKNIFNA